MVYIGWFKLVSVLVEIGPRLSFNRDKRLIRLSNTGYYQFQCIE